MKEYNTRDLKDFFKDTAFLKENIHIGLQKTTKRNILKKNCKLDGMECYLYIFLLLEDRTRCIMELPMSCLKYIDMNEDDLWKYAYENLKKETVILRLEEMLPIPGRGFDTFSFVLTNKEKLRGASAILNEETMNILKKRTGICKWVMLPSSIHEVILSPHDEDTTIGDFTRIVKEINCLMVEPKEQLQDKAYIINI